MMKRSAALIHADRIDILVDLTMHMAGGRPLLFARKPAPIQIAWLAYPGTTGIGAMDYRLSDPRLDPDGFDAHYSERTLRLPDSFWCYDPLTDRPLVNELPAIKHGYLTIGCLNNPWKLTDHTLRLWSGVMRALPDARLLLMAPPGRHRQHLSQRLSAHGMAEGRIEFRAFQPRGEYLCSYHDIDLGLIHFPTMAIPPAWIHCGWVCRSLPEWAAPAWVGAASANYFKWVCSNSPPSPTRSSSASRQRSAAIWVGSRRCAGNCGRASSAQRSWMLRVSLGTSNTPIGTRGGLTAREFNATGPKAQDVAGGVPELLAAFRQFFMNS